MPVRASVARRQEFEQTLVSIKETQLTAEEALSRATEAEQRARSARHEAEEERARARRERGTALEDARAEAQRALAEVQAEIRAARELLARAAMTDARLETAAARLDERVESLFGAEPAETADSQLAPAQIEVGATARSRDGWEGIVAEIDARGGQATLVAGSLRISVPLADLEPVITKAAQSPESKISAPRPRAVPSSLDLRGARVEEALAALDGLSRQCFGRRRAARDGHPRPRLRCVCVTRFARALAGHPLIKSWRAGERGEGGDGATIVEF